MSSSVLVAGASSKIGRVVCGELVRNGYLVYAGYRNNPIPKSHNIIPIKLDITSEASCKKAIKTIHLSKNKLGAVINLVGTTVSGDSINFSGRDLTSLLDTNVVGAFILMKAVLPVLPKNGRIVNIGSLSGLISFPNFSLYSATKFALRGLSLGLYQEWVPRKRYIVCVTLGAVANDSNRTLAHNSARSKIPLLKLILSLTTPETVAKRIVEIIRQNRPPAEILVGNDTLFISLIYRLLPTGWWTRIQQYIWLRQQPS